MNAVGGPVPLETVAEALARALGEFHCNPEWTAPVGSVGLDDDYAFRAAQGKWEEQEEERQAQTEAMTWALQQPAVTAAVRSWMAGALAQPEVVEAVADALRAVESTGYVPKPGARVQAVLAAAAAALTRTATPEGADHG